MNCLPPWVIPWLRCVVDVAHLPKTMTFEDVVQCAALTYLETERSDKFKSVKNDTARVAYLKKAIYGAISEERNRQYFGPSVSAKALARKQGREIDYGEVSLSDFEDENGECYLPHIACYDDEYADKDSFIRDPPIEKVISFLRACDCADPESSISPVKRSDTKQKTRWHVDISLLGKKAFVGQFDNKHDAISRKRIFIKNIRRMALEEIVCGDLA